MSAIKTFVFCDIEATGLRCVDPPKITEIAFTACSREHFLGAASGFIPRALYKLLLPINPQKVIHPEATRMTGLDNYLLENLGAMDANTIDLINCYFKQLKKPVCLVAHYGKGYDFPILKAHLKKLDCSFVRDLLCVDSLDIFRRIEEQPQPKGSDYGIDEFLNTDLKAIQNKNETTPPKNEVKLAVVSGATGEKPSEVRRLFDSPTTSCSSANTSANVSAPRISYSLSEIYKRSYGNEACVAHSADADAMLLLMCAIAHQQLFVRFADSMATKFST